MGTTQYPGATPFWLQVAVVVIQIVWGILLLKKVMQARGGIRVTARCPTGQRLLLLSPDSRHT